MQLIRFKSRIKHVNQEALGKSMCTHTRKHTDAHTPSVMEGAGKRGQKWRNRKSEKEWEGLADSKK